MQDVIGYVQNELGEIAEREEYIPEQAAEAEAEEGAKKKGLLGFLRK